MIDTILRIRLFVAVYEERSFTAAALRENSTQSGVTQHIRQLEEHLGVTLFIRGPGAISPTPAGEVYYGQCLRVLQSHSQSRLSLEPFKTNVTGRVSIGLTPTISRATLAPALALFVAQYPNVIVEVTDAYGDIVVEKVRSGALDCGVVPSVAHVPGLRSEFFARSPEVLVAGALTKLDVRHGRPVRLRELGPIKIVVPTGVQQRRKSLDDYLSAAGAVVERRLEIDTALGALDFVARSDWVSIHPGITMLREMKERRDFIIAPLVDPPLTVDLFRIERARDPLPAIECSFLRILQEQAVAMADEVAGCL